MNRFAFHFNRVSFFDKYSVQLKRFSVNGVIGIPFGSKVGPPVRLMGDMQTVD